MPDLANTLQESLALLRVATVVTASLIGLVFMAADLLGAFLAIISGVDPVDPPTSTAVIIIFTFTCISSAIECLVQGSIMPIVIGLLFNFALLVFGSILANIAQNLGLLLGFIALFFIPYLTVSVHAALLNNFLNQCGASCYQALNSYSLLSNFINLINSYSIF